MEDILQDTRTNEDVVFDSIIPLPCLSKLASSTLDYSDDLNLKKKARFILLFCKLMNKYPAINETHTAKGEPRIVSFEEFDEPAMNQITCLEEEVEQERQLQDGDGLVDHLIGKVEENLTALHLQGRMQTLSTKFELLPGKTVVVFDTNCFLGDFANLKAILDSKKWIVFIPLVVITELQGLLNNDTVQSQATDCLEYLKAHVSDTFQLFTARGQILKSLDFTFEEWDEKHQNADDVILESCRFHLPNVCLVTSDTNLRLKARTVGVHSFENTGIFL